MLCKLTDEFYMRPAFIKGMMKGIEKGCFELCDLLLVIVWFALEKKQVLNSR